MIETITTIVIPQRIEELIGILLLLVLWIYHFGLREESKIKIDYSKSISETVSIIIILSSVMAVVSYLLLKALFWFIGGIFT